MSNTNLGRIIFFWDYDTQWGADSSRSMGGSKDWGLLEFENTERLLDVHSYYRMPACFAVVGSTSLPGKRPYHDPDQIREIHARGNEIAGHSMCHDWLPGLDYPKLITNLRETKETLEQCIGASVVSFVPPFNQPFDYFWKGSISLSERREAGSTRTDIPQLCRALSECGYTFARISYASLPERMYQVVLRRRFTQPAFPEKIQGITCLRLNTSSGFGSQTLEMIRRVVQRGGFAVVYGHPHALHLGNAQDERYLVPLMEYVKKLVDVGSLEVILPQQIVPGTTFG